MDPDKPVEKVKVDKLDAVERSCVDVDVFLSHYGVQGMKWGVRRAQYKAAKQTITTLKPEVANRQAEKRYNGLSDSKFNSLSAKPVVVGKGQTITRFQTNNRDQKFSSTLYVSTNKEDAARYRAVGPTWTTKSKSGVDKRTDQQLYEATYVAVKQLRSPSEKDRIKTYIALMDQKKVNLDNGETVTGREFLERNGLGQAISGLSSREVALRYYGQLTLFQGIRNEPLSTAYFNEVRKKGYNAIVDDNDRGIIAKTPFLLLDPGNSLKSVKVSRLTQAEVHKAQASLTLPQKEA